MSLVRLALATMPPELFDPVIWIALAIAGVVTRSGDAVMALGAWGQRWTRRELAEHEIDLGLLLWELEKGAHPEQFGDPRRRCARPAHWTA